MYMYSKAINYTRSWDNPPYYLYLLTIRCYKMSLSRGIPTHAFIFYLMNENIIVYQIYFTLNQHSVRQCRSTTTTTTATTKTTTTTLYVYSRSHLIPHVVPSVAHTTSYNHAWSQTMYSYFTRQLRGWTPKVATIVVSQTFIDTSWTYDAVNQTYDVNS